MKNLLVSLVVVVVFSVFSLGWVATEIYDNSDVGAFESQRNDFSVYKSLGGDLAYALDNGVVDPHQFLSAWPKSDGLQTQLTSKESFTLPGSLLSAFERGEPLMLEEDGEILIYFYLKNNQSVLSFIIPKPLSEKKGQTALLLTLLFYLGVIVIVLVWLYPLLRRLVSLRSSALAFGSGDLGLRIPLSRWSYISDIESSFNIMAHRIEKLMADNKLLGRAVSHDLKTPLARLRFGFEVLSEESHGHQNKYYDRIDRDLSEMESLVDTLLSYSRLDDHGCALNFETVDLNALVSKVANDYRGEDKELVLDLYVNRVMIKADVFYLKMLINNVMVNALRYSKRRLKVSTVQTASGALLAFEDDGPGINEEDRDNVLKPFFRGSDSPIRDGHGMGLAIVSKIVEWHGATIVIEQSKELLGARVEVLFPF